MHKSINAKNDDVYEGLKNIYIYNTLSENKFLMKKIFNHSSSLCQKDLTLGIDGIPITLFYVDETIDEKLLVQNIVKPILNLKDSSIKKTELNIDYIQNNLIPACKISIVTTYDVLVYEVLCGSVIIFVEGQTNAFMIKIPNTKARDIDTPDTEQTVSGGKQAFVENLKTNINILRNLIRNPELEIRTLNIGIRTKSPVSLIYLNGIINEDLPKEILKRLNSINVDGLVDTSQIQALIQEHKWTIFPQLLTTERVDRTISEILNGKAIILLEGSPFALVLPSTLNSFLNSQDDIYGRSIITSILKIIRYIGFFEACSISALYLALTTYHPGLLPTSLALSITGTRVGLPFPVYIEILLMEITLYLVQEAALRLPKSVGNTVGIVGGLVIGQSVVLAGIISPIIVVIVSMSAISSFTLPNYNLALSTIAIRLFLIFCSMTLGLYGFVIGVIIILIHLASLDNFGVKYLADYSPYNKNILKENLIRAPLSTIHKRPKYLNPKDDNK